MSEYVAHVVVDFPAAPRRVFQNAVAVLIAHRVDEVAAVIAAADQAAAGGKYVAGFVVYEAAPAFDAALHVRAGSRMPLAWFGVFESFSAESPASSETAPRWQIEEDAASFAAKVERIREEIAAGRTYQVNLTTRMAASFDGDAWTLYEQLRRAQGSGYHAYIDTGEFIILSASPELFFERRGRHIRTKPMKGTRPRGRYTEEDDRLAAALAASEKDRAENLMIVDLLRNDLGRVAETGSVQVTALYDVERYHTVHQMVSVIEADVRDGVMLLDTLRALFPCGSVTGAPKISTMELIAELEDAPREVYCGAIGVLEPGGDATFSVPIRTAWIDRPARRAVYGTGAGITFDSDPAAEYREILAKAAVVTEAWPEFELLETMRIEHGKVSRRERHVKRLLDSAAYFGVSVSRGDVEHALAAHANGTGRLRLLVSQAGGVRAEIGPLDPVARANVTLASRPVSSTDRFLFHKTTHRRAYEERQIEGFWDVLLWNEREEVTEFTRGNVVIELDGRKVTPPRDCGLLAGVLREELLDAGEIEEQVVRTEQLAQAGRVWFINSLRGWVEVDRDRF